MVFDYMDHDLTGLMQRRGNKFEVKHVCTLPILSPSVPAIAECAPQPWPLQLSRFFCCAVQMAGPARVLPFACCDRLHSLVRTLDATADMPNSSSCRAPHHHHRAGSSVQLDVGE